MIQSVKKSKHVGKLCLMLTLLSTGCSTVHPLHDYCQIAKPICMQSGEPAKLSDATDRQIDAHNETGAKVCGWKGCKTH